MVDLIKPDWPAPAHIKAYTTTRMGGYSLPPYDSLNLALHVGDNPEDVETNRLLLKEALDLTTEPFWLNQVHSNKIICSDAPPSEHEADGSFAKIANKVCVVLTADCLPLLLTDSEGTIVTALHCGWRSILGEIIEHGVEICTRKSDKLLAWLGPAIAQNHYEVGNDLRKKFITKWPESAKAFIPSSKSDHWLANIYLLAKQRLQKCGVNDIYGGECDTYIDSDRFYSYRRDGEKTGRMATLIWISPTS